jgi:hypothetical protein
MLRKTPPWGAGMASSVVRYWRRCVKHRSEEGNATAASERGPYVFSLAHEGIFDETLVKKKGVVIDYIDKIWA